MYSKKLKEIRKKLGFSQEEMAFKTNTSYRAYSSYERGDRKPSFEFLQKLVEEFGVNLNWLIADNGIPFIEKEKNSENLKTDILKEVRKMLENEGILKK